MNISNQTTNETNGTFDFGEKTPPNRLFKTPMRVRNVGTKSMRLNKP